MNFELKKEDNIFIAGASGMVEVLLREFLRLGYRENSNKGGILTPSEENLIF